MTKPRINIATTTNAIAIALLPIPQMMFLMGVLDGKIGLIIVSTLIQLGMAGAVYSIQKIFAKGK